jgi:hypothetical protein
VSRLAKVVIDTGVFVEYIDKRASFHSPAKAIIESIGAIEVFLPPITLAEVCYIAARLLEFSGAKNAFEKASEFVNWIYTHPAVTIINDLSLHTEAARVKLEYNMALADCYILALSKLKRCKAVFRKREKEMSEEVEEEFDTLFLEDYM